MFRAALVLFCLGAQIPMSATAQEAGPIYDLLEAYRNADLSTPEAQREWAEAIQTALVAHPEEEWSTRVRAYEEVGSIYWRNNDFEGAAPVFLDLWQESEQRGDTDLAVTSIDHLINLYTEAQAAPEDILALYDATESWLQSPGPGQEEQYEKLLRELYYERAGRLDGYARDERLSDAVRAAYAQESTYFNELAAGVGARSHVLKQTMEGLIRHWAKNTVDPAAETSKPVATETGPGNETPDAEWPSLPPPKAPVPAVEPPPLPPTPAVQEEVSTNTPDSAPAEDTGSLVIPISIGVIVAGWALAAYIYLKRRS